MAMGVGTYRRRIRIVTSSGYARADLEDDPHRYGVVVHHDGRVVTSIEGNALRTPWSLCPSAVPQLQKLVGMGLDVKATAVYGYTASSHQCTHLFELAGLAIANAARGIAKRQYDIAVSASSIKDIREISLLRDGALIQTWTCAGTLVLMPSKIAGSDVRDLRQWAERALSDADEFELVILMRRAAQVAGSRYYDLDTFANAASIPQSAAMMGACFVYQPGVAEHAERMRSSTLDFTIDTDLMLSDLDETA